LSYFGNFYSKASPVFDVVYYGAKGDGVTDDTPAFNAAIAAWYSGGGGTIFIPSKNKSGAMAVYLILGALALPNTGVFEATQPPLRITSDGGPDFNGFWININPAMVGGPVLDMRYSGADGQHLAKFDTRGAGFLEIDHITFADLGTDNLPFIATTSTTIFGHHCAFFGNPGHAQQTSNQDAWVLGQNGYAATNASMTSGSNILTVGAGDPPFTAAMMGYNVSVAGAGAAGAILTNATIIAPFISATQAHLSTTASTNVSATTANYWASGTGDMHDAFQGYGTRLSDNFYSRIRRGVTFNQYSNSVVVDNETYSQQCGSSETFGAPYIFSGVPGFGGSWGCTIRGCTVEVNAYKYVAALLLDDGFATFDSVQAWDPSGGYYQAFLYSGANARFSTIIVGYSNVSGAITAGPTASIHTIISNAFVGGVSTGQSSFPGGFSGSVSTTGSVIAGAPAAAGVSTGDVQAARSATFGTVFFGNGTAAQTADIAVQNNKFYFAPTSSLAVYATLDAATVFTAANLVATAVAPTVAAGSLGIGSTTATTASAGANGDVPAQVEGYLIFNVGGANKKIPYYPV